jgi:hypothetical protein
MFPQCGRHLTSSCKLFLNPSFSYILLILPVLCRNSATTWLTLHSLVYLQEGKTRGTNCDLQSHSSEASTIAGTKRSSAGQMASRIDLTGCSCEG